MKNDKRIAAVIVAAGRGLRMGGEIPKQYLKLCGRQILTHSIRAFEESCADYIVIVCPKGDEQYVQNLVQAEVFGKVKTVIAGGKERFDSCRIGIAEAAKLSPDYIMIHDGVRPLVSEAVIDRVSEALESNCACCPGVAVKDTIRTVGAEGYATGVLERSALRIIQTPQGFRTSAILSAYEMFEKDCAAGNAPDGITDDAMLVEYYLNEKICIVEGSYENIKITTPEDMLLAETILKKRS